jgi:cyclopropane fatty-acyl-phospholipid synthase-like methyltransferase
MSRNWQTWWNEVPAQIPESSVFEQVARTRSGEPTGEADITATAEAIVSALELSGREAVLDLCCGNGLLSRRIAAHCRKLIGVDYSYTLVARARKLHSGENIDYLLADVTRIDRTLLGQDDFDAAYMAFSFQYFDHDMAALLFQRLRALAGTHFKLFLESIPDRERIFAFYDTPERHEEYRRRKAEGTEAVGHWWTRDALTALAESEHFRCELIEQDPQRTNAHYRFDALLHLVED